MQEELGFVGLSGPFAMELCRPAWQAGGWSK